MILRANTTRVWRSGSLLVTGLLSLGCSGDDTHRSVQDFVGRWRATSGSLQQVCDGVQTSPSFSPYFISLQPSGDGRLSRIGLDGSGAPAEPCPWLYVITGGRAALDGKQSCAVVTGPTTATTVWFEDTLTLSEDLQTLEQQGTTGDGIACTTSVDVHHTLQVSPGTGGAAGGP